MELRRRYIEANRRPHRASGGKSCGKPVTDNLKENAPYKVKTGY
jgi:ribosomal protein L34E